MSDVIKEVAFSDQLTVLALLLIHVSRKVARLLKLQNKTLIVKPAFGAENMAGSRALWAKSRPPNRNKLRRKLKKLA